MREIKNLGYTMQKKEKKAMTMLLLKYINKIHWLHFRLFMKSEWEHWVLRMRTKAEWEHAWGKVLNKRLGKCIRFALSEGNIVSHSTLFNKWRAVNREYPCYEKILTQTTCICGFVHVIVSCWISILAKEVTIFNDCGIFYDELVQGLHMISQ